MLTGVLTLQGSPARAQGGPICVEFNSTLKILIINIPPPYLQTAYRFIEQIKSVCRIRQSQRKPMPIFIHFQQ